MGEEKNEQVNMIFSLEETFPDAEGLLIDGFRRLHESQKDALIVLDTNILLIPYILRKETIDEIRKVYQSLISGSRLYIPKRVVREFINNRTKKLSDIYASIAKLKSSKKLPDLRYPIIEGLKEREQLDQAFQKLAVAEKNFNQKVDSLANCIKEWEWRDPVSLLYYSTFNSRMLIDTKLSYSEIYVELKRRNMQKIPPGYKDSSKDDSGVGDLIIWFSVLELAEQKETDIILVSEDMKSDWWQRSNGREFLPRYELIDEFRRRSNGKCLHIVNFSKFLKMFKASEKAVEATRRAEEEFRDRWHDNIYIQANSFYLGHGRGTVKPSRDLIVSAIRKWFNDNYKNPNDVCPYDSKEGGYIYIYGGPYDARQEIGMMFGEAVEADIIDEVASELEGICFEWSGNPES